MNKPKTSLTKEKLENQYSKILKALEGLYSDVYRTSDKQSVLESELKEIKSLLINILQYYKDINDLEKKIFIDHLKSRPT